MRLIIVRHGQTDDNVKKVIAGQGADTFLNANGILQAKKAGHHLRNENVNIAYVSDQSRAVQTAKEILEFHPSVKLVKDKKLRERNYGEFEGRPSREVTAAIEATALPFEHYKPKGGESHTQVQARIGKFFEGLLKKYPNGTILIVSHGRAISALLLKILDKPITKENHELHRPENTGFSIVEIFQDKPVKVHKLNSLEHLN